MSISNEYNPLGTISPLPSGYVPREYIENIDYAFTFIPPIKHSYLIGVHCVCKANPCDGNDGGVYGYYFFNPGAQRISCFFDSKRSNNNVSYIEVVNDSLKSGYFGFNNLPFTCDDLVLINHNFFYDRNVYIKIAETEVANVSAGTGMQEIPCNIPFGIFNRKSGNPNTNESNAFHGKIYELKITYDKTLIHDLRPCLRLEDNAAGFYDIITKNFYGNVGRGYFYTDKERP